MSQLYIIDDAEFPRVGGEYRDVAIHNIDTGFVVSGSNPHEDTRDELLRIYPWEGLRLISFPESAPEQIDTELSM